MRKSRANWRIAPLLFIAALIVGCQSEPEETTALQHCYNHFKAESYKVAQTECSAAANDGEVEAQWLLAQMYRYALIADDPQLTKAFEWYRKAAESGHVESMRELGIGLLNGEGVEVDYQGAYLWLKKAANKQDTSAEFSMGLLFFEGKGREKDLGSAINWFQRAAVKKHIMSINNLAWIFATSNQRSFFNPKKANYWIGQMEVEHFDIPMFLDTKAAVHAAQNDFDLAIETQKAVISKLDDSFDNEQIEVFQSHLQSYEQGKAWRE